MEKRSKEQKERKKMYENLRKNKFIINYASVFVPVKI